MGSVAVVWCLVVCGAVWLAGSWVLLGGLPCAMWWWFASWGCDCREWLAWGGGCCVVFRCCAAGVVCFAEGLASHGGCRGAVGGGRCVGVCVWDVVSGGRGWRVAEFLFALRCRQWWWRLVVECCEVRRMVLSFCSVHARVTPGVLGDTRRVFLPGSAAVCGCGFVGCGPGSVPDSSRS